MYCSSSERSDRARAVSRTPGRARVAAARAHEPSVTPAQDAGNRRRAHVAQDHGRRLGRLGPPALVERRARLEALQVQPPQVQARLGAVLEAAGQRRVGERVITVAQPHPGEMAVAPRDVLRQPGLERERDAALQLLAPGVVAGQELHRAHRVERVEADLDVVEVLAELQRARAPGDRALGVLAVHAQGRDVRVGQPELASGPERFQRGHGFVAEALRFGRAVAGTEEHHRQAAQPVALAQPVAQRSMALAAPPASPRSPRRSRRRGRRRGSGPRGARRAPAPGGPPRSAERARTEPPPRDARRPSPPARRPRARTAARRPRHRRLRRGGRAARARERRPAVRRAPASAARCSAARR